MSAKLGTIEYLENLFKMFELADMVCRAYYKKGIFIWMKEELDKIEELEKE